MLKLDIPKTEIWDEINEQFIHVNAQVLKLEHSLVSISKWEQKWHKPYMSKEEKTDTQTLDYIRCMTINEEEIHPDVYLCLTNKDIREIADYIKDPATATIIKRKNKKGGNNKQITSELIYYWMTALQIPVEFENWHLNRLLTLIEVCDIENSPDKNKMSKQDTIRSNAEINAARRKMLNSKG